MRVICRGDVVTSGRHVGSPCSCQPGCHKCVMNVTDSVCKACRDTLSLWENECFDVCPGNLKPDRAQNTQIGRRCISSSPTMSPTMSDPTISPTVSSTLSPTTWATPQPASTPTKLLQPSSSPVFMPTPTIPTASHPAIPAVSRPTQIQARTQPTTIQVRSTIIPKHSTGLASSAVAPQVLLTTLFHKTDTLKPSTHTVTEPIAVPSHSPREDTDRQIEDTPRTTGGFTAHLGMFIGRKSGFTTDSPRGTSNGTNPAPIDRVASLFVVICGATVTLVLIMALIGVRVLRQRRVRDLPQQPEAPRRPNHTGLSMRTTSNSFTDDGFRDILEEIDRHNSQTDSSEPIFLASRTTELILKLDARANGTMCNRTLVSEVDQCLARVVDSIQVADALLQSCGSTQEESSA